MVGESGIYHLSWRSHIFKGDNLHIFSVKRKSTVVLFSTERSALKQKWILMQHFWFASLDAIKEETSRWLHGNVRLWSGGTYGYIVRLRTRTHTDTQTHRHRHTHTAHTDTHTHIQRETERERDLKRKKKSAIFLSSPTPHHQRLTPYPWINNFCFLYICGPV